VYLEIGYAGDVARLSAGGRLVEDSFFNGETWSVGLKQMLGEKIAGPLELSVLPLRRDAPVYFELARPVEFDANGQAARVDSVKLVPEYEVRVGLE